MPPSGRDVTPATSECSRLTTSYPLPRIVLPQGGAPGSGLRFSPSHSFSFRLRIGGGRDLTAWWGQGTCLLCSQAGSIPHIPLSLKPPWASSLALLDPDPYQSQESEKSGSDIPCTVQA